MPWDLPSSLLKKEERESARLADFEFKLRARTFRLLAGALDIAPNAVVPLIASGDDATVLDELAARFPENAPLLHDLHGRLRAEARVQLIAEEGDPSPFRLV